MNSRTEEMDSFIKYLGTLASFDKDRIYGELMEYGLPEDEKNSFDSLIGKDKINPNSLILEERNKVQYGSNIRDKSGSFLYFEDEETYMDKWDFFNDDKEITNATKLYIPASKENIQEVATKVLLLYDKFNVRHSTKISPIVRADDLVTRITSHDDVGNFIEFVNRKLSDKVIKTNPFILREGVVGIAYDGELSFNEQLSIFLSDYLSENQDDLDKISLSGFKKHMQELKGKVYTDKNYIKRTLEKSHRKRRFDLSDLYYLYDMAKIIELINIALEGEKGLEDFEEYWKTVIDSKEKEERIDKLERLLKEIIEDKKKESNREESEEKKVLIERIINYQKTIKTQEQEIKNLTKDPNSKGDVTHED